MTIPLYVGNVHHPSIKKPVNRKYETVVAKEEKFFGSASAVALRSDILSSYESIDSRFCVCTFGHIYSRILATVSCQAFMFRHIHPSMRLSPRVPLLARAACAVEHCKVYEC